MTTVVTTPPAVAAKGTAQRPTTAGRVTRYSTRLALFPARLFLALGWLRAGVAKAIDAEWWSGAHVRRFLDENSEATLPLAEPAVGSLSALAPFVAAIVLVGELLLAVGIVTGRRLRPALLAACGLNVIFVAFGAVNPSAFYLVIQMTLLLGLTAPVRAPSTWRRSAVIASCAAAAVALVPFITTVHPAEVIDDPALMLITVASLVGLTQLIAEIERR